MFDRIRRTSRMWRFETLTDFAGVLRWLRTQHRKGLGQKAQERYLREITPTIRRNIDRYQQQGEELDALCGQILSNPAGSQWPKSAFPHGVSLLENLQHFARELGTYFDQLLNCGELEFLSQWRRLINSPKEYMSLLKRLVGDFGNFEVLLPALPGTGPVITDPRTQQCLDEMYRINTQNLRMLELIYGLTKAWKAKPSAPSYAFFNPHTDLKQTVTGMLNEYLIRADPVRIRTRQQLDEQTGRHHAPYRFWRAAENFRLLAKVSYLDAPGRKPVIRRRYVDASVEPVPTICTDIHRQAGSLKEIVNNSLSASSHMYAGPDGQWIAKPLDRHIGPHPAPAIRLRLKQLQQRRGFCKRSKRTMLRLTVLDEGVGIDPEHLPYVTLWGYSPRREDFRTKAQQTELTEDQAHREIRIGGKGIGLAYASAVAREHGGELRITGTPTEGACVTVDLPVPTPLRV